MPDTTTTSVAKCPCCSSSSSASRSSGSSTISGSTNCYDLWGTFYNCHTGQFSIGGVAFQDALCGNGFGNPANIWYFANKNGNVCELDIITQAGVCPTVGDCTDFDKRSNPPSLPDQDTADQLCNCSSSSRSSTSSNSSHSSTGNVCYQQYKSTFDCTASSWTPATKLGDPHCDDYDLFSFNQWDYDFDNPCNALINVPDTNVTQCGTPSTCADLTYTTPDPPTNPQNADCYCSSTSKSSQSNSSNSSNQSSNSSNDGYCYYTWDILYLCNRGNGFFDPLGVILLGATCGNTGGSIVDQWYYSPPIEDGKCELRFTTKGQLCTDTTDGNCQDLTNSPPPPPAPDINDAANLCPCNSSSTNSTNSTSSASINSSTSSSVTNSSASNLSNNSSTSPSSNPSNSSNNSSNNSSTNSSINSSTNSSGSSPVMKCFQQYQSTWQCDHWGDPFKAGDPFCSDSTNLSGNTWVGALNDPCTAIYNGTTAGGIECTVSEDCQIFNYPSPPPVDLPSPSQDDCPCQSSSYMSNNSDSSNTDSSTSNQGSSGGFTLGKCATMFVTSYDCIGSSWRSVLDQQDLCVDPNTPFNQWLQDVNVCILYMYVTDGTTCRPGQNDCIDARPPTPQLPTQQPDPACCGSSTSSSV